MECEHDKSLIKRDGKSYCPDCEEEFVYCAGCSGSLEAGGGSVEPPAPAVAAPTEGKRKGYRQCPKCKTQWTPKIVKNCPICSRASTPPTADPAKEIRDTLRQAERDALVELWDATKIMCESLPLYSASSSAFQRKQRLDAAIETVTQILGACV